MSERTSGLVGPQAGDVVVIQLTNRRTTSQYLVSRRGRRPHAFFHSYMEAWACATRQARRLGVDVWYSSDDEVFVRLGD